MASFPLVSATGMLGSGYREDSLDKAIELGARMIGCDAGSTDPLIRANLIHSQLAEHAPYGGVVPEIAARAHLDHIAGLIGRALAEAGTTVDRLDGVAAAAGPPVAVGVGVRSLMIAN